METTMIQEQVLLRTVEAAKLLGCSRTRVYELVQQGHLPAVRLGGTSIRIPRIAIDAMIQNAMRRAGGGSEGER
jgi:excisionase family DNA binding protein